MPSAIVGVPVGIQEKHNPITCSDASRVVTSDHQEHKVVTIGDDPAAMQQNCKADDESSSSSSEEDVPQTKADILAAAGVSINLEELQMLQAEQAPLELVTEVKHTTGLIAIESMQNMFPNHSNLHKPLMNG